MKRSPWFLLLLITVLVIALRLPSILEPLDNNGGDHVYHARLILAGEPLYSTHHPGHHMPGVYYTYALSFLLFGGNPMSSKWLLIPWTILTAWILFWIGQKFSSPFSGVLAAIFYSVLSAHMLLMGMTAESELFVNLPITAAVGYALALSQQPEKVHHWIWVGGLSALAILYKAINITPLGVAVALVLAIALWGSDEKERWKQAFQRLCWLGIGFSIPLGGLAALYASQDLLGSFLLVFLHGFQYTGDITTIAGVQYSFYILFPILVLAVNNFVVLILAFGGGLRQARQLFKAEKPQRVLAAGFLAWTLLALVQAGITKIGFVYYVLPMVPPFALLTGMEVRALRAAWFQQRRRIWGVLFAAALIAAVLVNSALVNGAVYRDFAAYALGQITYTEYLTGHLGTGKLHLRISEVAGYIRARTAPEEKVYYWGNAVQFYELAERRCASENIWPYYAGVFQPVEELFGAQTPYMVVERSEYYDPPPYLREYLAQGYVLEATIEQHEIYRYTESEKK